MNGAIPVVQWEEANFPIAIKETGADGSRKFGLISSMFNRSNGKKLKNKMEARQRHFDRVRFGRRLSGMQPMPAGRRAEAAFTMIEIAIAIGVIGFALVAVIGILPRGMVAQKDNREDTLIMQDAPYFMNAIRNGEMRTNNSVFTNYVESITITTTSTLGITTNIYTNPSLTNGSFGVLSNDMAILGWLTTPEVDPIRLPNTTNQVVAIVRAMSGSAMQQNAANAATAFRYQLSVEIDPWNYTPPNYGYTPYNPYNGAAEMNFMAGNLHEMRLRFAWPVLPNGSIGPNRQTYRTLINSHMTNDNGWWFFLPQTYSVSTNS